MARPYDVLVYGATGFTGRLVAEYMAAHAPRTLRWGIAGRNRENLEAVRSAIGLPTLPVVVASGDLSPVTRSTRAVLSTVGPFVIHGEPLVRSCVENGCDYVDSTGEVGWVAYMERLYGERARAAGVLLVSLCGFDSIPADLGCYFLSHHVASSAKAGYAAPDTGLASVRAYVTMSGAASGGTMASMMASMEHRVPGGNVLKPTVFIPKGPGLPAATSLVEPVPFSWLPRPAPEVAGRGKWAYFFFMSPINSNVVRRSAATWAAPAIVGCASKEVAAPYTRKQPFSYMEYQLTSSIFTVIVRMLSLVFLLFARFSWGRTLLQRVLPRPGEGPSAAVRAKSFFRYTLVGTTDEASPRTVVATVTGGDPGYTETAKMLAESVMLVATRKAELPAARFGFGFLTPATAFGSALVDRLNAAGLRFDIVKGLSPATNSQAPTARL